MHKAFKKLDEQYLEDISSKVLKFEHIKTKAQVIYIQNNDTNKAFCIGFKTIISDSTGVAHILEHSVLNGSTKYPVKEPFAYLAKNSLQTYLNASTYPDKTIYPVSSINQKELQNMAEVYLDSVFCPNLSYNTFLQEGWRYVVAETDELSYTGVVFNEMKGSFANTDSFVASHVQRDVLADTDYAFDAGGVPNEIPNLTYDVFKAFHKKYYHPTNSRTVLYGDLDPIYFLELLDNYFNTFGEDEERYMFKELPKMACARSIEHKYQCTEEPTYISVASWAFPSVTTRDFFGLMVLHYLLIVSDASPLKKYLLDKKLGTSLFAYGYESDMYLHFFAVGLKGILSHTKVVETEEAIVEFFSQAASTIDTKQLLGAINRIEYMFRSDASNDNSKGVELYSYMLKYWLYDRDPVELLKYSSHFEYFKNGAFTDNYFKQLIQTYFIDNTNCVFSRFSPDAALFEQEEVWEKKKLSEVYDHMVTEDLEEIIRLNKELKAAQETIDTPESLATLPMLSLEDVSGSVVPYSCIWHGSSLLYTEIPDKKMLHLVFSFDVSHVSMEDLPYLSVLTRLIFKLGTHDKTEDRFISDFEEATGELSANLVFISNFVTGAKHRKLSVRVSLLEDNLVRTLALLEEGLVNTDFSHTARIKRLLDEIKTGMESDLVELGHKFALRRALSSSSSDQFLWDLTSGVNFFKFLQKILEDKEELSSKALILSDVVNKNTLEISLSCSKKFKDTAVAKLMAFKSKLPAFGAKQAVDVILPKESKLFYAIPTKVNYVAKALKINKSFSEFSGINYLLRGAVQYEYLWNEVRVKGGAYGGLAYCHETALLGFVSYRDPHIERTLTTYAHIPSFLMNFTPNEKELLGYKIGGLADLEPYVDNDSLGFENYIKYLTGQSVEIRQGMKGRLLSAEKSTLAELGQLLAPDFDQTDSVVVLGNPALIQDKTYFDDIIKLL